MTKTDKEQMIMLVLEIMRKNGITALDLTEFGIRNFLEIGIRNFLEIEMINEDQVSEIIYNFNTELKKKFNVQ
jgi:hypothetical protein